LREKHIHIKISHTLFLFFIWVLFNLHFQQTLFVNSYKFLIFFFLIFFNVNCSGAIFAAGWERHRASAVNPCRTTTCNTFLTTTCNTFITTSGSSVVTSAGDSLRSSSGDSFKTTSDDYSVSASTSYTFDFSTSTNHSVDNSSVEFSAVTTVVDSRKWHYSESTITTFHQNSTKL
jgi:hypothetical protein